MPETNARVELQLGGVWTDITGDVRLPDRIKIVRGRRDQGARVDPGSCTLTLNNALGRYSPRNPVSPLYGLIGRNTPIRVSAVGGAPWLGLPPAGPARVRATTPTATALNISGDLDVRFDVQPDSWLSSTTVVELGGKWGAAGQRSWHAYLYASTVRLGWTTDGTTEVLAAAPLTQVELTPRMTVRATLTVNNGAGGHTARFYTGPSMNGPWTQIGFDNILPGTAATWSSTAALEIGDVAATVYTNHAARLYAAQVRAGIGGTVVASPDFTAQAPAATAFTDSAGRTWTISAGGITNRHTRFVGEISAWPARWDVSGRDVYTPVQAAGILRRLGRGTGALDSTLRRRVPSDPNLIAYWPMEEGRDATQAYSPLPNVTPLRTANLSWAADDSLAGSTALPRVGDLSSVSGSVAAVANGNWEVQFVYRLSSAPSSLVRLFQVNAAGGVAASVQAFIGPTAVRVMAVDANGSTLLSVDAPPSNFFDGWGRLRVRATLVGTVTYFTVAWIVVGAPQGWYVEGSVTGTPGHITSVAGVWGNVLATAGLSLGHIGVFRASDTYIYDSADTGFTGESAVDRAARITSEEGVPLTAPYGIAGTALMGPQRPNTMLSLLSDAADADLGILYEHRDSIALAYRTRGSLYNQTPTLALDYRARGEVAPPLEPVEDDTGIANDITISRPSGSSARAVADPGPLSTAPPPTGIGPYPTTTTLNVATDDQLPDLAGWLVHLGSWDEARFPAITVNLAAGPWLAGPAMTADVGDRITIANPPPQAGPDMIDAMCQGYTETLGLYDWEITYTCTPYRPWLVGVLDDPVLGRADTDGSQLAAAVSATATALSVTVTAGPLWVTAPAEFPLDIRVGGEVMTVTACTGTSSPQTMTVIRSVNGITKGQGAGTDVRLATPMITAL